MHFLSADFFSKLFRKILSEIPSECQSVWNQIRFNILSGLIWVQTVCKSYQEMALVGKDFRREKLFKAEIHKTDF